MSNLAMPFAEGALIVSCQARPGNPLHGPAPMALMAKAAVDGGAAGIRANGPVDVAAIRAEVSVPIIGIYKQGDPSGVSITPTAESAAEVVRAGADLVALDGTQRPRPDGRSLAAQIEWIHDSLGVPVLADVDSVESALAARDSGADAVATTLSGYTLGQVPHAPDIRLVADLVAKLDCAVVAEGRYRTGTDVRAALDAGAYAVVVGTAITNPLAITRRLVEEMR
jgi:N-acylglucosamine-6-phosphate 2-epimerase